MSPRSCRQNIFVGQVLSPRQQTKPDQIGQVLFLFYDPAATARPHITFVSQAKLDRSRVELCLFFILYYDGEVNTNVRTTGKV